MGHRYKSEERSSWICQLVGDREAVKECSAYRCLEASVYFNAESQLTFFMRITCLTLKLPFEFGRSHRGK